MAGSVLRRSLAADLAVGSNLRGEVSGGGWLYALPRLSFRSIVCVGAPADPTLATLARASESLLVVEPSSRRLAAVARSAARRGWTTVRVAADLDDPASAAPDLVVATDGRMSPTRAALVARALAQLVPDGAAYLASDALRDPVVDRLVTARGGRTLAIGPSSGEVRSVVPAEDADMRRTVRRLGLEGATTIAGHPKLAAVERRVRAALPAAGRSDGASSRTSVLIDGGEAVGDAGVPAWVRDAAASGGRDLDGWRWAVAARGDYDSQKVLVLLAAPGAAAPSGLVKVTRSSAHADRLDNEAAILERLGGLPLATGRAPAVWFRGRHAGRSILGESMVDGVPFASRARWAPNCPYLDDALGWLTELGIATRAPVPAASVSVALLTLLERYAAIHPVTPPETTVLQERFAAMDTIAAPIPTVLQHGDPGIWNLLVDVDGRTVFLDWEAGEPDGLPLWDLLYFFRSYAVATSRRAGVRDRLEAASRHLLADSPLGQRFAGAVATYRDRVGVPAEAIEPLVYGCWVHRALKEATRLAPGHAGEGQYARLIRRMVSGPTAPILIGTTGVPA
jgi:hypothetical protein